MSLVEKSDVKDHLSPDFRTKIHLCQPISQPDATGFSEEESDAIKDNPPTFSNDFTAEHSSVATPVASTDLLSDSTDPQLLAASKSAQA